MDLAACFVVHHTSPLRTPEIKACKHGIQRARHQHIVEVGYHVIGVLHLSVDRCHGQNQSRETTHGEHEDKAHCKQHGCLKCHRAFPHGRDPVKNLHPSWNSDQHRGIHEKQLACDRHASGIHVVRPDNERQNRNRRCGVHHGRITKQFLAGKCGNDVADDAESRQDHDVDLRVSEEPKDVLVHHRVATASRVEEGGAEVAVGQCHGDRASQHRHHSDQQISRDQPSPNKHWHLHQSHARGTHIENGHDDVDRTHDGRRAQQVQRKNA